MPMRSYTTILLFLLMPISRQACVKTSGEGIVLGRSLVASEKTPFIDTVKEEASNNKRRYNVTAACLDFLGSLGLVPNHYDYRSTQ